MKLGISTFVTDEGIRPDKLARAVEERGFDSLFLAEHSHIPVESAVDPGGSPLGRPYFRALDPFVALTAAAMVTTELELGTGVMLLPQRDTIQTAKQVASLDHLSGGRVVLAVGAGWNRVEMENHGVDPRTRGARLDEQISALRRIWTEDVAEFHGEHVDFGPIHQWPKPVRQPYPPILVGGHSPAAQRRALALGDGWFPISVDPSDIRNFVEKLPEARRATFDICVPADRENLARLREFDTAGARRATFYVPTEPEPETIQRLDRIAAEARLRG